MTEPYSTAQTTEDHLQVAADSLGTDELLRQYHSGERDFAGKSLVQADLQGFHLLDIDLRNADLTEANLSYCTLHQARLQRANLSLSILYRCSLGGANLTQAKLNGASLIKVEEVRERHWNSKTDDYYYKDEIRARRDKWAKYDKKYGRCSPNAILSISNYNRLP